jgi:HPt (histidine-containing phosphotransfer) domain-containing protein
MVILILKNYMFHLVLALFSLWILCQPNYSGLAKTGWRMKNYYLLKTSLFFGAILLTFLVALYFNSMRVVSIDGIKTISTARIRFNFDAFESKLKDALYEHPKGKVFNQRQIKNIDDLIFSFEEQVKAQNLPVPESIRIKWDQVKYRPAPDMRDLLHEIDQQHKLVNKKSLDDILKREATAVRDTSTLMAVKILIGVLIFTMVFLALNLDTLQTRQKNAQAFLIEMPKAEESIEQLLSTKNINDIHKIGHASVTLSETVGAVELTDLFKQLEQVESLESAIALNAQINQEAKTVVTKLHEQVI